MKTLNPAQCLTEQLLASMTASSAPRQDSTNTEHIPSAVGERYLGTSRNVRLIINQNTALYIAYTYFFSFLCPNCIQLTTSPRIFFPHDPPPDHHERETGTSHSCARGELLQCYHQWREQSVQWNLRESIYDHATRHEVRPQLHPERLQCNGTQSIPTSKTSVAQPNTAHP